MNIGPGARAASGSRIDHALRVRPAFARTIGCTQVFIKKPGQAVIFWDGFFFSARKINQPKGAPD